MEKFVIEGGVPLSGTIVPAGNKNGALPILAACLLTEDEVVLRNVPRIRDVEAMLMLLEGLGAQVAWRGPSEVSVDASSVEDGSSVDTEVAELIRASFLVAGPLLARFGRVRMPPPGGDVIGRVALILTSTRSARSAPPSSTGRRRSGWRRRSGCARATS
jgi:UDP-N-acetylglucosamine 1-carboxyvinyltransferase